MLKLMRMREQWIDSWKGLLISLVVLGHVVGGGCHLATGLTRESLRMIYFLVYAFHMPAFFFLVGWMWKEHPLGTLVRRRFIRLMIPYFVVGVISILIYAFVGGDRVMTGSFSSNYYRVSVGNSGAISSNLLSLLQGGGWPNGQGFRYNTVLWFLPCMFLTQVAYGVVRRRVCQLQGLVLMVIVAFCIMIGLVRMGVRYWPWGVDRVPYYLVFVGLGEIVRRLCPANRVPVVRFPWMAMLTGVFFACVWFVDYQGVQMGWFAYLIRIVVPLLGIYLSVALALATRGWGQFLLCIAGTYSMTIMLWHKFFVVGAQIKMPFVSALYRSGLPGAVVATIGVTIGSMLTCWLMAQAWKMCVGKFESVKA